MKENLIFFPNRLSVSFRHTLRHQYLLGSAWWTQDVNYCSALLAIIDNKYWSFVWEQEFPYLMLFLFIQIDIGYNKYFIIFISFLCEIHYEIKRRQEIRLDLCWLKTSNSSGRILELAETHNHLIQYSHEHLLKLSANQCQQFDYYHTTGLSQKWEQISLLASSLPVSCSSQCVRKNLTVGLVLCKFL